MTLQDILIFDVETCGLIPKGCKWDENYMEFPQIVSIAWIFGEKKEYHIIMPIGYEIPEESTKVHGITTEYANEHGEVFANVIDSFISDALNAQMICGHNIHFDTSIVKANILRYLGKSYYDANNVEDALFKGKRIDTMTSTMKWVDARAINGRLKFPNLTELYHRCFPKQEFDAHNAMADVKAVRECLPKLIELGLVKLELKTYEGQESQNKAQETIFSDRVDSCTTEKEKMDCRAKNEKITDMLNQNEF